MRIIVELGPEGDMPGCISPGVEGVKLTYRFSESLNTHERYAVLGMLARVIEDRLTKWGTEWTQ